MLKRLNVMSEYNQNMISDFTKCDLRRGGGILIDVRLLRQQDYMEIQKCLISQKEF